METQRRERGERTFRKLRLGVFWCSRRKAPLGCLVLCSLIVLGSCGQHPSDINADSHLPNSPSDAAAPTSSPFLLNRLQNNPSRRTSYYSLFPTSNNKQLNDMIENNNQLESANTNFQMHHQQRQRLPQHTDLDRRSANAETAEGEGRIIFPSSSSNHETSRRIITSYMDDPPALLRFPEDTLNPSSSSRNGRNLEHNTSSPTATAANGKQEPSEAEVAGTTLSPLYRSGPELLSPSLPLSSIASSVESSRKASPDVQDIIDGIVKLLGGKVKDAPAQGSNIAQQQNPVQHQRPYNLFNPNKPLVLTPRPTRINNRGPVIANPNGQNLHSGEFQLQQQQAAFEAIPLEAINNGFNLSQTKFGPPFPLSQIGQEAPYKQGVPLPEQIVPTFQQQQQQGSGSSNFHIHQNPTAQKTPTEEYYGLPAFGESPGGAGFQQTQPQSPSHNNNAHIYHHVSAAPSSSSERDQHVNIHNVGSSAERIPTTIATTVYDYFNKNTQRPTSQTPTTLLVPTSSSENSNGNGNFGNRDSSNERLTTVNYTYNVDKSTSSGTTAATTMQSKPLQAQVQTDSFEDDEKDQQRAEDEAQKEFVNENLFYNPHSHQHQHHEPQNPIPAQIPALNPDTRQTIQPNAATAAGHGHIMQVTTIEPTRASTIQATYVPSSTTSAVTELSQAPDPGWPTSTAAVTTRRPPPVYHNQQNNRNGFEPPAASPATATLSTGIMPTTPDLNSNVVPTPPLRPGIVIHEGNPNANKPPIKGQGFGSVEVVTALDDLSLGPHRQQIGDVFDVTVTAKQGFGVQPITGQPFVTPVDLNDEIITAPNPNQQFVAIDGKRTYFNLHAVPHAVGSATPTELNDRLIPAVAPQSKPQPHTVSPPRITTQASTSTSTSISSSVSQKQTHPGTVGQPTHPFVPKTGSVAAPSRAVSTSLSIQSNPAASAGTTNAANPGSKAPPNIIRRPAARKPSIPPVRIDTCIVGDDSTCNSEQSEVCRTESGVSSCICRPGYARRRHREPCRAIVSLVMSIRLDKLGDKKLSYDPEYFNPNSEIYQSIEWETIHGIDAIVSETTLQSSYIGAKLDAIGFDGRFAVVNSTILIHDTGKLPAMQVKRELQRQVIQNLNKHRNNFGKTQLWVDEPVSAISAINDVNECESLELNDCDVKAKCINTFGSFECKCEPGYGDLHEKDRRRSGKKCESCSGKLHCNGRGECLVENNQKVCKCAGNYYGSQCDIDGEVMAVAIGASVSALIIIALTLACLCMWSRRWKREEQKAALMSRTLFGGMASQALSYISSKNNMNGNPYQQHVGLEERLRWAQVNDSSMAGNIYVQNEPLSLHASPTLLGASLMDTPPMMSTRRSSDTCDTTVDDLFEERHPTKRPKSRSSQLQPGGGGIYYDLEPDTDIYATRQPPTLVPFSQFCVPMNPYSHSRGFYN